MVYPGMRRGYPMVYPGMRGGYPGGIPDVYTLLLPWYVHHPGMYTQYTSLGTPHVRLIPDVAPAVADPVSRCGKKRPWAQALRLIGNMRRIEPSFPQRCDR